MASDIMDDAESSQGAISVMTLHNNEAGRKVCTESGVEMRFLFPKYRKTSGLFLSLF